MDKCKVGGARSQERGPGERSGPVGTDGSLLDLHGGAVCFIETGRKEENYRRAREKTGEKEVRGETGNHSGAPGALGRV